MKFYTIEELILEWFPNDLDAAAAVQKPSFIANLSHVSNVFNTSSIPKLTTSVLFQWGGLCESDQRRAEKVNAERF